MTGEPFKIFSTPQHARMTIKELVSSRQRDIFHVTENGIVFDGVEIIGTVNDVKIGDDYARFMLFSMQQDASVSVRESGNFRNEEMCNMIGQLSEGMRVLVRGKYSIYEHEGEIKKDVHPKQIIIVTDERFIDLFHALVLKSRVENNFPVIIDDEACEMARSMGLRQMDANLIGMIRFNYTVGVDEPEIVREQLKRTKPLAVTMPAREPETPGELERTIERRKEGTQDDDALIDLIMNETGMTRDDIEQRIQDVRKDFMALTAHDVLVGMAKDFKINMSGLTARETTKKTSRPVERKRAALSPGDAIIDYLEANGGEIDMQTLRSAMTKDGYSPKEIESSLLALFGSKKIAGDPDRIQLAG